MKTNQEIEIEYMKKTKTPRCLLCLTNMIKESEYTWKTDCKHYKNLRLLVG